MRLLCRLGWHDWTDWRPRIVRVHWEVVDQLGNRRPVDDYNTTEKRQYRYCRCCQLEEERE